jgi:hypothetical protein
MKASGTGIYTHKWGQGTTETSLQTQINTPTHEANSSPVASIVVNKNVGVRKNDCNLGTNFCWVFNCYFLPGMKSSPRLRLKLEFSGAE